MFDSLIYVARILAYLLGWFVKQVLGAMYARLVDTPGGIGQSRGG